MAADPMRNRAVRVGDGLWGAAQKKAVEKGDSLSDVVRQALEVYAAQDGPNKKRPMTDDEVRDVWSRARDWYGEPSINDEEVSLLAYTALQHSEKMQRVSEMVRAYAEQANEPSALSVALLTASLLRSDRLTIPEMREGLRVDAEIQQQGEV